MPSDASCGEFADASRKTSFLLRQCVPGVAKRKLNGSPALLQSKQIESRGIAIESRGKIEWISVLLQSKQIEFSGIGMGKKSFSLWILNDVGRNDYYSGPN